MRRDRRRIARPRPGGRRGDTVLVRAKVTVVLVSPSGKPQRIGTLIRSALERFVNQRA